MPAKPELFSETFRRQRGQHTIRSIFPSSIVIKTKGLPKITELR